MDVSGFMGGNFLSAVDVQQPQVCTIREITQQLVGSDSKICVRFDQHPKMLGLNKTNLRTIAEAYGIESSQWIGRPVEVYRDTTFFQGQQKPCVRVRIPQQPQPQAAPQQQPPAAAPAPQQQPPAAQAPAPVAAPQQQDPPWAGQ